MFRTLLVDDEKMALVSTLHSFEWKSFGFSYVETVSDAFEAERLLNESRFDAAFVDIRMPGISGLELISRCRENGIDTEFIMVSGYSDFEYAKQALRLGAFDFCVKPIQPEEVSGVLPLLQKRLIEKRRGGDPPLYSHLLLAEETEQILSFCGISDAEVFYAAEYDINGAPFVLPFFEGGIEAAFFLSETHAVRICAFCESSASTNPLPEIVNSPSARVVYTKTSCGIKQLPTVLNRLSAELEQLPKEGGCKSVSDALPSNINVSFEALLCFVRQNFTEELLLQRLAKQFNLNYTYCSELFQATLNVSFSHYVTALRMEKASGLLRSTRLSVDEVSQLSGYNNYHYFAGVFKKTHGMTPSDYRQTHN